MKAERPHLLGEMVPAKSRFRLVQWLVHIHSTHCGLFPLQVRHSQSNHIDRYLVCGKNYKALRDAVGKVMIECKPQGLLEAEKVGHVLLAIALSWVLVPSVGALCIGVGSVSLQWTCLGCLCLWKLKLAGPITS